MRPSSVGPQLVKYVTESSLELSAPTVMLFLAHAGGAVEYQDPLLKQGFKLFLAVCYHA